jgi:hypothetical protein
MGTRHLVEVSSCGWAAVGERCLTVGGEVSSECTEPGHLLRRLEAMSA